MKFPLRPSIIVTVVLVLASCASTGTPPTIRDDSVAPGSAVTRKGAPLKLAGTPLVVGLALPITTLVRADNLAAVNLSGATGKVLVVSVVPSLDTPVCEAQTHLLAEKQPELSQGVQRITVSRDTVFAQKRFAEASGLTNITYLSDHKNSAFGRSVGLLIDDLGLLARAVVVVDREGIVRHIQVVPEITHLPDIEKALEIAATLAAMP